MAPVPRRSTRPRRQRHAPYKISYGDCPSMPINESKYFFATNEPRLAIMTPLHPTSLEFLATPEKIQNVRFDPHKWQDVPRPANFHGAWPPATLTQLMDMNFTLDDMGGNRAANQFQKKHGEQVNDDCLGKFCWQEAGLTSGIYCHEANCDHTFRGMAYRSKTLARTP